MIDIEITEEDNISIISVGGDVDASSSIHLDEALRKLVEDSAVKYILIDCTRLEYISSAGLGVFMSYIDDFKTKNIRMVLFGLSNKVMNVFQILGLDQLLYIVPGKKEAKEKLHEVQS
ncbi:STAS domain-containing protein [Marivirga sp. S37H4]|uniref:Anti-sigma factor antagonist n=1 Tax=Marivirga aurantiaca TaxID=2802615 RepID=A0A934X288_9BACT|nr:STAS domain-containing protein [Marivirga aurantiaca]MBK6267045.1 STAS domain-containing protein [Marivirga aurantiaca]